MNHESLLQIKSFIHAVLIVFHTRQFLCCQLDSCETRTRTLIKIAMKLQHVSRLFLGALLNHQCCRKHIPPYLSKCFHEAFACCLKFHWLVCGLSFIVLSVTECEWHVCYSSSPHWAHWEMAAKEPHEVLSLYPDIHLGNSNRAIITASS